MDEFKPQKISNRSKSIETNKEWEQITKIFDSLETLLNEVVESTSKPLKAHSIPNTPTITTRKKELGTSYNYEPILKSANSMSLFPVKKNHVSSSSSFSKSQDLSDRSHHTNSSKSLSSKNLKQKEICDFLARISMNKYEMKFIANGYDNINFLNGVVTLQDLLQIGIENYDDALKILKELKYLPLAIKRIGKLNFKFILYFFVIK